jgi:hypothetical protein
MLEELKNRKEIVEELTEILMDFDRKKNKYQTDVYLYYDEETQTAKLDTFVNVGGNSWLDDEHYTIYRDMEHHENWSDYYCNDGDFAWGLDMSNDDFEKEVIEYLDLDEGDKEDYQIQYIDAYNYIKTREDYMDKLIEVYKKSIDEARADYAEQAELIISEWEEETEREEQIKAEGGEAWNKFMGH